MYSPGTGPASTPGWTAPAALPHLESAGDEERALRLAQGFPIRRVPMRRGAGAVDRVGLENRSTGNCTVGSNPTLSAIKRKEMHKGSGYFDEFLIASQRSSQHRSVGSNDR